MQVNQSTSDILQNARRRGALFGVMVDLQKKFNEGGINKKAFQGANELTQTLRAHDVENIWCVMRSSEYYSPEEMKVDKGAVDQLTLRSWDAFDVVNPAPQERLYIKKTTSLAHAPSFQADFTDIENPAFILAGVSSAICVTHTALGLFEKFENASVILATNAINTRARTGAIFHQTIQSMLDETDKDRLYHATNADIDAALET